jgi:hypothetical protein
MATNCLIGYKNDRGQYIATRVHYDGYPSGVLRHAKSFTIEEVSLWVTRGWLHGGISSLDAEGPEFWTQDLVSQTSGHDKWCITDNFEQNILGRHNLDYAYMIDSNNKWFVLAVCHEEHFWNDSVNE